ncbi:MAG: NAD(P)/FAD-dependent oxidoreductase [Candidatus Eiseniibacteriota bacterium]|nr:MAG: NAD(P)/FAD-dependent oxidoreductase [Candidatus Eisenbacteria bacterium]
MQRDGINRRDFIKSILAGASIVALDWASLPIADGKELGENEFDAVIIGSGLGGLSCAAAFARQGFKPLVLEQHSIPGGYATTFARPGGFVFDVSLHSTVVGERDGIHNLIPGFPEIEDVRFVPHPYLYRAIFPEHEFRVPQKDLPGYIKILSDYFPDEAEGIAALMADMSGISGDIGKLSQAQGQVDMSRFPMEFPYLFSSFSKTWGQLVDARIKNPKLKAIVSALWGYYGLPPSKLASIYYALPTIGYLTEGGYYPVGRSQKISDAFVSFIEERGGKVKLKTRVKEILTKDHAAYGVKAEDGSEYRGKVVVSNANAYDTFHTMMQEDEHLKDYLAKMDGYSVSLSSFQVFLGLKKDLVREVGIPDTEIFCAAGYNPEAEFEDALHARVEGGAFGLMIYDNLYDGYSPEGKNTLGIIATQGYDHWKKYEEDYFKGNKTEYRKEKERMAAILIKNVEKKLLPGLSAAIEVKEIGTPLTNVRYTSNYRGAIYGWDQTLDNSNPNRMPHATPIENLYLSGAWTSPGGGYGGVLWSGLECFGQIMAKWKG